MTKTAKIKLPLCWRDLIGLDFPLDLHGVTSEKHLTGLADPNPHYDDAREICAVFSDGRVGVVSLQSGQSNYFGWLSLHKSLVSPVELYSAELESFDDLDMEVDGTIYALQVDWAGEKDF